MDLLCTEKITQDSSYAMKDLHVLEDQRVLRELLDLEDAYVPSCDYFKGFQSDVKPKMRAEVTKWMLEVCERLNCEDQVFPLAVNMFDRFLCECNTPNKFLQLVAADCILMASKLRQAVTIPIDTLCYYTNFSVTACQIRKYELLLAAKLNWDLLAVTGFDFIDLILEKINLKEKYNMIRRHALILMHLCYTEYDFMRMKPSTIATSCILSAVKGLKIKIGNEVFRKVCEVTSSPIEVVKDAISRLEWIVSEEAANNMNNVRYNNCGSAAAANPHEKSLSMVTADEEKPETPTDVQDVDF